MQILTQYCNCLLMHMTNKARKKLPKSPTDIFLKNHAYSVIFHSSVLWLLLTRQSLSGSSFLLNSRSCVARFSLITFYQEEMEYSSLEIFKRVVLAKLFQCSDTEIFSNCLRKFHPLLCPDQTVCKKIPLQFSSYQSLFLFLTRAGAVRIISPFSCCCIRIYFPELLFLKDMSLK